MTGEVRMVHPVRASRPELWRACSSERGLSGWYADRVTGRLERGGAVRLEWPGLGAGVDLQVVEFVAEERVAFDNGESRVTLSVSDGAVELTHTGLGAEDDVKGFESSWRVALAHLSHGLERHPGRDRDVRWVARRVRTSTELAHLYFTDSTALRAWLGGEARVGAEGERCSLELGSGPLTGRVLVRQGGRDVVLSWEERDDSALALRTLPSPSSEEERILAMCWSTWGDRAGGRAAQRELEAAMDRLAAVLSRSGSA